MAPRRTSSPNDARTQAEIAIASTLTAGGDSLPAWNAVWDLVQSTDSQGKQEILDALRGYVEGAVAGPSADSAAQFGDAIEQSMRATPLRHRVLPSKEVREQHRREQLAAHRKAMQDIGVRPGEGLPMWMLYMTRRSKRTWG